jgi:uncharacterized protein (DUF1501 family)
MRMPAVRAEETKAPSVHGVLAPVMPQTEDRPVLTKADGADERGDVLSFREQRFDNQAENANPIPRLREIVRVQVTIPCEGEALMVFVRFETYDTHEGQLWADSIACVLLSGVEPAFICQGQLRVEHVIYRALISW